MHRLLLLIALTLATLTACGNKGPLYLPEEPAQPLAAEQPADDQGPEGVHGKEQQ